MKQDTDWNVKICIPSGGTKSFGDVILPRSINEQFSKLSGWYTLVFDDILWACDSEKQVKNKKNDIIKLSNNAKRCKLYPVRFEVKHPVER